jgi:hypothetical protein
MPKSCCVKPIAKIIKVGDFEAGIVGFEVALKDVYLSHIVDERELTKALISGVRKFGNYIAPSEEKRYEEALLREYKAFCSELDRETEQADRTKA